MERHTHPRTHDERSDWQHGGRSPSYDPHERRPRPSDSGEPPSRPLLDRLTQAGGGRWVPISGNGGIREG